jgi:hypothetical protein
MLRLNTLTTVAELCNNAPNHISIQKLSRGHTHTIALREREGGWEIRWKRENTGMGEKGRKEGRGNGASVTEASATFAAMH